MIGHPIGPGGMTAPVFEFDRGGDWRHTRYRKMTAQADEAKSVAESNPTPRSMIPTGSSGIYKDHERRFIKDSSCEGKYALVSRAQYYTHRDNLYPRERFIEDPNTPRVFISNCLSRRIRDSRSSHTWSARGSCSMNFSTSAPADPVESLEVRQDRQMCGATAELSRIEHPSTIILS